MGWSLYIIFEVGIVSILVHMLIVLIGLAPTNLIPDVQEPHPIPNQFRLNCPQFHSNLIQLQASDLTIQNQIDL